MSSGKDITKKMPKTGEITEQENGSKKQKLENGSSKKETKDGSEDEAEYGALEGEDSFDDDFDEENGEDEIVNEDDDKDFDMANYLKWREANEDNESNKVK